MAQIKAKFLLLSIALLWGALIIIMSPLQLPTTIASFIVKRPKLARYVWAIWIGQDQLVNAILGGNPDVTISSKVGLMSKNGSKTARAMELVIDWLFLKFSGQQNHCFNSIEYDEEHYT